MMMQQGRIIITTSVGTGSPTKLGKEHTTVSSTTSHGGHNHVPKKNTSLPDKLVRRKAVSYLMAAKGLIKRINNKVDQLDHFFQLT